MDLSPELLPSLRPFDDGDGFAIYSGVGLEMREGPVLGQMSEIQKESVYHTPRVEHLQPEEQIATAVDAAEVKDETKRCYGKWPGAQLSCRIDTKALLHSLRGVDDISTGSTDPPHGENFVEGQEAEDYLSELGDVENLFAG